MDGLPIGVSSVGELRTVLGRTALKPVGTLLQSVLSQRRYRWLAVAMMAGLIVEPVLVAAGVVWGRYGRLKLSVFFAREEVFAALLAPFQNPVLHANIVYINFLKGEQNAEMYLYTIEALLFSAVIGALMGLNMGAWFLSRERNKALVDAQPGSLRRATWSGLIGGGSGGLGTVVGAAAGAAGCCGMSVGGGGILMGLGLSYSTAAALGSRSELLELIAIAILLFNLWYVAHAQRHVLGFSHVSRSSSWPE